MTDYPGTGSTPKKTFRIPEPLYLAAQVTAKWRRESLSDVVRRALEAYVRDGEAEMVAARVEGSGPIAPEPSVSSSEAAALVGDGGYVLTDRAVAALDEIAAGIARPIAFTVDHDAKEIDIDNPYP